MRIFNGKSRLDVLGGVVIAAALGAAAPQARAALVAHYPLDGNLNDVAGGFHGTATSGAPFTYVATPLGQGLDLNGSNQYATLTSGSNLQLGGNFTVSAHVNVDVLSGDKTILGNATGGNNQGLHLITRGTGAHLGFFANDTGPSGTLSTDTWHHIAWQFDNGTQRVYLDGNLVGSNSGRAAFGGTAKDVLLGSWGGGNFMDGTIDDVAVFNTPLSGLEIGYLAGGGSPAEAADVPVIKWDFENDLQGWTTVLGAAHHRSGDGGGVTPANASGGFAHDGAHENFLIESPQFYIPGGLPEDMPVIMVEMAGGMGDQSGNIGNYMTAADVAAFNGGNSNSEGVKALGFVDLMTGEYLEFLLNPDNGGIDTISLTMGDLLNAGLEAETTYALQYFETDQGGWGWGQLNSIMLAGVEGAYVPEPGTAALVMMALGGLGLRRRRRTA